MIEELLKCKLCGGNVSSGAQQCPHCGTCNFKSDIYKRQEQKMLLQKKIADRVKRLTSQLNRNGFACLTSFFGKYEPGSENMADQICHKYFPNDARVYLKVNGQNTNCLANNSVELFFDGQPIDYYSWVETHDSEIHSLSGGNVLIKSGQHQIVAQMKNHLYRPVGERKAINFYVDKTAKYIVVNYKLYKGFFSGYPVISELSVQVKTTPF